MSIRHSCEDISECGKGSYCDIHKICLSCETNDNPLCEHPNGTWYAWSVYITFLCFLSYCVSGSYYNYSVEKQPRWRFIPHYSFWLGVSGLVRDGIMFSFYKVSNLCYRTDYVSFE